jgi:PleD family two-component response regulator
VSSPTIGYDLSMAQVPAATASIFRPVKILVADDHATIRKMVVTTLQEERHFSVVGEAENGLQASKKLTH